MARKRTASYDTLKADPRLVDMGTWSDGWPVRRLSAEHPKAEGAADQKPQAGVRGHRGDPTADRR